MRAGVTMVDPRATYVDASVVLAPDVRLLPGTILEARTTVATGAVVGTYPTTGPSYGVAFDGTNIWLTQYSQGSVLKIQAR